MSLYTIHSHTATTDAMLGGKGKNLAVLSKHHFPVPQFLIVTANTYKQFMAQGSLINLKTLDDYKEYIQQTPFPPELQAELQTSLKQLGVYNKLLAVRSSAIGEDGENHSFAGQLDSFLYVRSNALEDAIKKVWQSLFSLRAQHYFQSINLEPASVSIAVIVQEMLNPQISGVSFSRHPLLNEDNSMLISSVYGVGEGLVSGILNADTYTIQQGKVSEQNIVLKDKAITLNTQTGYGIKAVDVPPERQELPSLNEKQIKEVIILTKQVEKVYGKPQDIEWAIDHDKLYILQTRPITTLAPISQKFLWDNANIVESYSSVTTPLTFSFIQDIYTEVYKQFCLMMGVEPELIEQNTTIFSMLGLIKGRVYYNLVNWYNLIGLLPGYTMNAKFMEQMMGVQDEFKSSLTIVPSSKNKYLRVLMLCSKQIQNFVSLPRNVESFYSLLEETLAPYETNKLTDLTPYELYQAYKKIECRLLKNWQAPIINDFYTMIFYGILKKLLTKWDIDPHGTLQNDLLAGQGYIISTEPIRNIRRISNFICDNKALQEFIEQHSELEVLDTLHHYPELKQKIDAHIQKFGSRCIGELKLETQTYKHRPDLLITFLKSYVKQGYVDLEECSEREILIRKNAEEKVKTILQNNWLKQIIFDFTAHHTREKVKNRENLRFERTRLFAVIREIFLAIGQHLEKATVLSHQRDIFYLTKEEIFNYITGTSTHTNLKELIALRKVEFDSYQQQSPPDRFSTTGFVYLSPHECKKSTATLESNALSGIGCSPGFVRARIKIVTDPSEVTELPGCIMVAEKTDPGWVPLFPMSQGILVERGSVLSHSAIVAREMGIPAIVGIKNLLRLVKDGTMVEMDGTSGVVKIPDQDEVS